MVRGLTRKQTTSRTDNVWPDMWKHMSDAAKRKAKQNKNGLSRNRSSIMPDNYVVSSSLNLRMKNSRTSSKTLVGSQKFRCQQQCLAKTPANCRGETCRSIGKRKTKCACIVDADESMRIRLEGVPHRYH